MPYTECFVSEPESFIESWILAPGQAVVEEIHRAGRLALCLVCPLLKGGKCMHAGCRFPDVPVAEATYWRSAACALEKW